MEYDLDSNAVDRQGRTLFLERFIHGETYKARPDVMTVIHSHSPTVIPFSISQTPLQPVFNGAAFLSPSAPVFDIRKVAGMTDLLIGDGELGKALAATLGQAAVALLRGHGNVVVGETVQQVVYRAIQTELNARLQLQAVMLGAPLIYLAPEEAVKVNTRSGPDATQIGRTWELWKQSNPGTMTRRKHETLRRNISYNYMYAARISLVSEMTAGDFEVSLLSTQQVAHAISEIWNRDKLALC